MKNVLFIIINFVCFSVFAQDNNKDIEKLKKIIYTFADDSMTGRAAGTVGEEKVKKSTMAQMITQAVWQ
ncbi:MAG: hypothetical protein HY738_23180 [Bacteroidia bacterium]|nr:hypothetical protein [Bacteroidia bacterium]